MVTLFLFADKFPEDWEPSTIWYIVAVEGMIVDAPLLGILARVIFAGWL